MKAIEYTAIDQSRAYSAFITATIVFWIPLALGLKGQPAMTYLASFMVGCMPLCLVAYLRPFFNPYANFLTQRDPEDLTADERESLKILKARSGKKAVFRAAFCVIVVLGSLYLVRDNRFIEAIHLGKHTDTFSAIIYGGVLSLFLTLSYLLFFWSRVLNRHLAQ